MLRTVNAGVEIEWIDRSHRFQTPRRKAAYVESEISVAVTKLSKDELLDLNRRAPVRDVLVTG
jgi:hypothetical protein